MVIEIKDHYVDFAIITALPIETIACLSILWDERQYGESFFSFSSELFESDNSGYPSASTPELVHVGFLTIKETTKTVRVLVCKTASMGGVAISELFSKLKHTWNPKFFILTGIGMSFNLSIANLRDVVVSDTLLIEPTDKIHKKKIQSNVVKVPMSSCFHKQVFSLLSEIDLSENRKLKEGEAIEYSSKVVKGAIYSSNHVIASNVFRDKLWTTHKRNNLVAGEMEALGFFSGTSYKSDDSRSKNILVVKGISDSGGDDKKDTDDRFHAARNAAFVCKEIITSGLFETVLKDPEAVPKEYKQVTSDVYHIWLSDHQRSQGLFKQSFNVLKDEWESLIQNSSIKDYNTRIVEIAWRLAKIEQERGNVEESLVKTMIACHQLTNFTEDTALEMKSQVYLILGKIALDVEMLKTSSKYFRRSRNCAQEDEKHLIAFEANRWLAYSNFRNQKYGECYSMLCKALDDFLEAGVFKEDYVYYSLAECIDMMSRCLREEALQDILKSEDGVTNPILKKIYRGLSLNSLGKQLAFKSGNYFKMAESDLTYLYYHYYPQLSAVLKYAYSLSPAPHPPAVVKRAISMYGLENRYPALTEDDFRLTLDHGSKLSTDWGYRFLEYSFARIAATIFVNQGDFNESIEHISNRVRLTKKDHQSIRFQERYRTFVELNELFLNYDQEELDRLKESIKKQFTPSQGTAKDSLYPEEFFKAIGCKE